jgi:hypothetical protein
MYGEDGRQIDKGPATIRSTLTTLEKFSLKDAKENEAKIAKWERTHPDPLKEPGDKIGQLTKDEVVAKIEHFSVENRWEPLTEKVATFLLAKMLKAGMDHLAFNLILKDFDKIASEKKLNAKDYEDRNMKIMADTDMGEINNHVAMLTQRSEDETKLARRE